MSRALWSRLRDARYALPGRVGALLPLPDPGRLAGMTMRGGMAMTFGHFAGDDAPPGTIVAAHARLVEALAPLKVDAYLSVKAPQLGFDPGALREIAALGRELVFDAHAPHQAEQTHALAAQLGAGCVIPARWRRSAEDLRQLRDAPVRLRLVKGEWADPDHDQADPAAAFLKLAETLAGRAAPVAVATHDPALAATALLLLKESGTPCELEQLRGLPRRRTCAAARDLNLPVRLYLPFGPGWWPYAIDKALARPYLPRWWLQDLAGVRRAA